MPPPRRTSLGLGRRSKEISHGSDNAGGTHGPDHGGEFCGDCPATAGHHRYAEACSSKDWSAKQPLNEKIHVEEAWQITKGDPAVVVA